MLPAIVQQKYAQAKTAFDHKDYVAAEAGFTEVIKALGDPDLGTAASQPPLSDMGTLASGFKELSVREIARAAAEAPPPSPQPKPLRLPKQHARRPPANRQQQPPRWPLHIAFSPWPTQWCLRR